ncbi:hypothetical protein [Plantactinospora endophytica]|uniref:Lantibiotic dehydratase N-terminal domain-containing protein n=1 Tax=Plantactinospora endophytica TaxID=673535 RepID=A0ABQ4DV26_9ACTN|nr:hypothetical protein [Plantactinospora endophytica]GIG86300.1 hypothetical protein Pen02_12360 [Plantactinospora endophytica]
MRSSTVDRNSRLAFWRHVREFAVPRSMIESATARRTVGDWAGACAAARVDVDLRLRAVAREYGRELAVRIRADLSRLAPDLLRWHMPRILPDGLLRPGLTVSLARYPEAGGAAPHLVARTPPAWADAGQRISLALWDPARPDDRPGPHPHPRPDRRYRLDLHRHLWDASRAGEFRVRSGADRPAAEDPAPAVPDGLRELDCAVHTWAAELRLLRQADGHGDASVVVRLGSRHRLLLDLVPDAEAGAPDADAGAGVGLRISRASGRAGAAGLPVLPDAAIWVPPDVALLHAGLIGADRLHPLVAAALVPDHPVAGSRPAGDDEADIRFVECRGARHRIGLVDGILAALDHDPAEIRREELLAALSGTPLPCLQMIDQAHRSPESLVDVRARLDHGDTAGALATVEKLLGPDALLRAGALRDELETAALRRVSHGLYRAGLADNRPVPAAKPDRRRRPDLRGRSARPSRGYRGHPRHATAR